MSRGLLARARHRLRRTLIAGLAAGLGLAAAGTGPRAADAMQGTVAPADWQAYRARFVDGGRVVDDANGRISHSEGQGYGLLLAFAAGDKAGFEEIWSFTRTELLIRDDGLAAWRWDPAARPRVTDVNNASDGDILIAYALARAGMAWNNAAYVEAAQRIAKAIGATVVQRAGGRTILLPGVKGFSAKDRPDGPIVNLSYWVFEALPILAHLAPGADWKGLARDGLALIDAARFGPKGLPSDWITLGDRERLRPAEGFEPLFGYNSLRIPLYLLRMGDADAQRLKVFKRLWSGDSGGKPSIVEVMSGRTVEELSDPGYRMLTASIDCALDGTPIPAGLKRFEPTLYYPSTLHLLGLSLVAEKYPRCL